MTRYYFDLREEDALVPDEEGLELSNVQAAQAEAALSLADMARDAVRMSQGGRDHRMVVEVRDDKGRVFDVKYTCLIHRNTH